MDSESGATRRNDALPARSPARRASARFTASEFDERLFDALPSPACIVDEETQRFLRVNEAASARFGWSSDELLALTLRDLHAGGEYPARAATPRSAPTNFDTSVWRARTKSGNTIVTALARNEISWNGRAAALLLLHDATEPVRVAEGERHAHALFHALAEHLEHVVWVGSADGDHIIYINPACRRVFGWPEECFYGDPLFHRKLAHPEDLGEVEALIATLVRDGKAQAEYRIVRADGGVRWVRTEAYVVPDKHGRASRHSGLTRDITARRESELDSQKLQAELERRVEQRTAELVALNRELETFSYSVSHDLKEPVRAIEGLTSILVSDHAPHLPPEARGLVVRLQSGAVRMRRLIDGLLSLSRVERKPLAIVPVDMERLASEVLTTTVPQTRGREVRLELGDLPPCAGDIDLLRVVLVNLVSNALKFTREREQPEIAIGFERGAYFVRDNGIGIDPRHAERVFQPFERLHAHEHYEGSGIGLATVRRIIERHHGRVWVDATPGGGATFRFEIPAPS